MGNIQSKSSLFKNFLLNRCQRSEKSNATPPAPSIPSSLETGPSAEVKPKFRWDDGRRFHGVETSAYSLPNDDMEVDRLHQQHYMLKLAFEGNIQAPVHELLMQGAKVLDVGCGPGTWIMDVAHDYPASEFFGIDISDVFPSVIKPNNCHFQIADIQTGIPFPDNTFDFVYQRMLTFAIRETEWPGIIKELVRVTKPKGWIQLLEYDLRPYSTGPINVVGLKMSASAFKSRGVNPFMARKLDQLLLDAGVVNVTTDYTSVPVNWGGRLGELFTADLREVFVSFKPYLTKAMALTDEQYEKRCADSLNESREYQTYNNFHYGYGQAPESGEKALENSEKALENSGQMPTKSE